MAVFEAHAYDFFFQSLGIDAGSNTSGIVLGKQSIDTLGIKSGSKLSDSTNAKRGRTTALKTL